MTSEELVMLSAACATCNRRVPIYLLEKHYEDLMENKEQEAREHAQMLSDMTVIRVKRRVPAKKEDKQPEEVKGGEEVFALTPKSKEATMATYAGDYDIKKSLVNTMLKSTPGCLETKTRNRSSMEAEGKNVLQTTKDSIAQKVSLEEIHHQEDLRNCSCRDTKVCKKEEAESRK